MNRISDVRTSTNFAAARHCAVAAAGGEVLASTFRNTAARAVLLAYARGLPEGALPRYLLPRPGHGAVAAGGGGLFSVFHPRFLSARGWQEAPPHATSFAAAAAGWSARGGGEVVVSVSDGNSLFLVLPYQIRDSGVDGPVAAWVLSHAKMPPTC